MTRIRNVGQYPHVSNEIHTAMREGWKLSPIELAVRFTVEQLETMARLQGEAYAQDCQNPALDDADIHSFYQERLEFAKEVKIAAYRDKYGDDVQMYGDVYPELTRDSIPYTAQNLVAYGEEALQNFVESCNAVFASQAERGYAVHSLFVEYTHALDRALFILERQRDKELLRKAS